MLSSINEQTEEKTKYITEEKKYRQIDPKTERNENMRGVQNIIFFIFIYFYGAITI